MPKPVRVVFDQKIFVYQRHGGMARYFAGLMSELRTFGVEPKVMAPFYTTERLSELPSKMVWGRKFAPAPRKQRAATILGELALAPLARLVGADIVHETYYSHHRRAPNKCKVVTTVHDMIPELFPQFFGGDVTEHTKKSSVKRADHIICISENTRRDFLRFFPEAEDRTSVVLYGFDASFGANFTELHPFGDRPYVLQVGGRGGWKNFDGLLAAFAQSRLPREGIDLVCIGEPLSDDERRLIDAAGLAGRVHRRGAGDAELANWYRHALVFAYPSLYEGFGIPPLEAMAAECPVVAARASSIPEVCGNAAEFSEPGNVESLAAALEKVAFSPERAEELRRLGRERVTHFSWRKCAQETSEVYHKIV